MADLASQHTDLAAVMRIVGYQIAEESGDVWAKALYPAIGVEVANAAQALGMHVVGFDPELTISRAMQLSAGVERTTSLDDLFARADVVTLHAPLVEATRNLVNTARTALMRDGSVILNFARAGIVDIAAITSALDSGKLAS